MIRVPLAAERPGTLALLPFGPTEHGTWTGMDGRMKSGPRVDRSLMTLIAAMCGLVLFVAAARHGRSTDDRPSTSTPTPTRIATKAVPRVTVPEPSGLVTGSLGVIALGIVYACRHRRHVQTV